MVKKRGKDEYAAYEAYGISKESTGHASDGGGEVEILVRWLCHFVLRERMERFPLSWWKQPLRLYTSYLLDTLDGRDRYVAVRERGCSGTSMRRVWGVDAGQCGEED